MAETILDITRPLGVGTPTWPGDTPFGLAWPATHADGAAVSRLTLSPHLGSHMDAPLHIVAGGADAAAIPLSACVGPCEVVAAGPEPTPISPALLPAGWKPSAPRVLFTTGTWPSGAQIPPRFASLAPETVDLLADNGVVLVGLDTPSVDEPTASELIAHRRCVARGVLVLEGLDLAGVAPGLYTLVALPLRLGGVEASPVRAVLLLGTP
jgi:arylformamidase